MSEKDGGPAFPSNNERTDNGAIWAEINIGMSLRDYFAAAALPVIITIWADGDAKHADKVASQCYQFADAMLRERERSNG